MKNTTDKYWNKSIMLADLAQRRPPVPHSVREVMKAKSAAIDAIADLLELLPQDDARCGMIHTLGDWLSKEIAVVPDDINYVE